MRFGVKQIRDGKLAVVDAEHPENKPIRTYESYERPPAMRVAQLCNLAVRRLTNDTRRSEDEGGV